MHLVRPDRLAVNRDRRQTAPPRGSHEKPLQHPLDKFQREFRILHGHPFLQMANGVAQAAQCVSPIARAGRNQVKLFEQHRGSRARSGSWAVRRPEARRPRGPPKSALIKDGGFRSADALHPVKLLEVVCKIELPRRVFQHRGGQTPEGLGVVARAEWRPVWPFSVRLGGELQHPREWLKDQVKHRRDGFGSVVKQKHEARMTKEARSPND